LVLNEDSKESAAQPKSADRPVETSTASSVSYGGVESSLFAMAKLDVDLDALVVEEAPSGCTNTLFACLGMGTPALDADLHEERRLFFGTSKLAMIDSEPSHFGLLLRIHEALVKPEQGLSSVSRYGKHWEEIGFQGSDPATDLRGTGMLSLLQMCYFVEDNPATLAQVWEVAKDKESGFPFAVVAINITRWTMDCIRGGKLNGIMNKEESVMKVANRFFSQAFVGFAEGYATCCNARLMKEHTHTYTRVLSHSLVSKLTHFFIPGFAQMERRQAHDGHERALHEGVRKGPQEEGAEADRLSCHQRHGKRRRRRRRRFLYVFVQVSLGQHHNTHTTIITHALSSILHAGSTSRGRCARLQAVSRF